MITKQQLISSLADIESYHIERTTSITDTDKFCQAICAFSNDLSGSGKNGYLILGAHDNGERSGLRVDDRLLLQISNIRTDGNILPQPVMTVEKFSFDEGDLLVVEVQPSEIPPVRYRGRVWVRVGPRKSFATEAEEKILTERRLSNIRTFDAMPCLGTSIANLDVSLVKKEFLPKAVAEEVLAADKRPIEEQLSSLGFYDLRYNCPTCGAVILFGLNPERYIHGSYVQYVRFKGKDKAGDILNEFKFSGNLCRTLIKIDNFIETSVAAKRPIPVSVLREETFSKYPYWATRELLMNAIMHRDYESNAPVQFYEYDDRIEIQNPGGLYGKVHPDNFPNVNDYRNPFIAEAMKILGYVNRFSRGVNRVQRELRENGNGEAAFDFSLITAFKVVENISEKYFEEGFGREDNNEESAPKTDVGLTPGQVGTESSAKLSAKLSAKSSAKLGLTQEQMLLILSYFENPNDMPDLMKQMQLSHRSSFRERYLKPLLEEGLLAMTMPDKPTSSRQKYYATVKGKKLLKKISNNLQK
jgi:ATP-dependent DNA helicase RecG